MTQPTISQQTASFGDVAAAMLRAGELVSRVRSPLAAAAQSLLLEADALFDGLLEREPIERERVIAAYDAVSRLATQVLLGTRVEA